MLVSLSLKPCVHPATGRCVSPAVLAPPTSCPKPRPVQAPPPQRPSAPPIGFIGPGPRLQGSIYLNDFARVVSSDHEAVNGVLHFIDRVLLPPDVLHWEPDAAPVLRV